MKKSILSAVLLIILTVSACAPGFGAIVSPTTVAPPTFIATTAPPTLTPTVDPTMIALEINATAMSDLLTQQAATLYPPTETPPPPPFTDPRLGIIAWVETISIPNRSSAALHPPQGLPLIFHRGYAYIFGGRGANDERLTGVYFSAINPDGTLAGWRQTTSLPGRYVEHVEVRLGERVYMLTGADGSEAVYYASFNADGSLGAWEQTASLTPSRQTFAAVGYGNFVYASGGNSGGPWDRVQYTSVKPDGSLYPWTDTTPLPVAIQEHTMIAYDGYLYVFGGKIETDELITNVYFSAINPDGTLVGWQAAEPLPRQMYGYGAFEANGYMYLIGSDYSYFTRVLEDHTLDLWEIASPLPAVRHGLRLGANNGYAYAAGGFDPEGPQNTVYFGSIGLPAQVPAVDHPDCTSGWTRLRPGVRANLLLSSLPHDIRHDSAVDQQPFALLPAEATVHVMEGPICTDEFVFWRVQNALIPGGIGWIAEGDGTEYYMEPLQ